MSTSTKITVEQYAAMIDRGEFEPREDHHVELIRGEIVPRFSDDPRTPMNPPHGNAVMELADWSYQVLPADAYRVLVQCSIGLTAQDSVPQPDVAWVRRKNYSRAHPTPDDIFLLIEVADSSLAKDRGPKRELYAEAKVREYWIVDVQARSISVHRDPQGLAYRSVTTYRVGQEVRPLAFPEVTLDVSRIFPD